MKRIQIAVKQSDYSVYIHNGLLRKTGKLLKKHHLGNNKVIVISDPHVSSLYSEILHRSLQRECIPLEIYTLPEGEVNKNLSTVNNLYTSLLERNIERSTPLIALGGGVVGDITGYVAATLLRGLPLIHIPTTILAQVDSAIGGKVGVDHPQGKNLIGSFYQPRFVLIDPTLVTTLDRREFNSGIAEVIKSALIGSPKLFSLLENRMSRIKDRCLKILECIITEAAMVKIEIIRKDPFEENLRATLNLGHTVGHALEAATHFQLFKHGEAISLGIMAACKLAENLKLCSRKLTQRVFNLLDSYNLPVRLPSSVDLESVQKAMNIDKKRREGKLRFILPCKIGKVIIVNKVQTELIHKVLKGMRDESAGNPWP